MAMGTDDVISESETKNRRTSPDVPALSLGPNTNTPPSNVDGSRNDRDYQDAGDMQDDILSPADVERYDDVSVFDEDDAAVILEQLAFDFGISSRKTPSRCSEAMVSILSKSGRRNGSASSPRSLLRTCLTKVLVDASGKIGRRRDPVGRLLSAKRNHIHNLSNDIFVLRKRIKDLEEKNRILLRVSKRQESALKRYHDAETELPHILEAHKMEIRILQDKLRKATDLNKKDAEKLRSSDNRIQKLSDELSKMKDLANKKNLPDRQFLSKKLSAVEKDLEEKEKENVELKKQILILTKSYNHQLSSETNKNRKTARKYESLREEHERTLRKITDCEKQLASLQLYRTRSSRNLSSQSSSPNESTALDIPGAVSSAKISSSRRVMRKSTARRLKPSSRLVSSVSKEERVSTSYVQSTSQCCVLDNERICVYRKEVPCVFDQHKPCPFDSEATCVLDIQKTCPFESKSTLIDLNIERIGWTPECKVNSVRCAAQNQFAVERNDSGRLPLLPGEAPKKACDSTTPPFSSDAVSSPDEFWSADNGSRGNDGQTTSVALNDSVSRKTTILSSWSDETRAGDFSLSRDTSPPTTIQQIGLPNNDDQFDQSVNVDRDADPIRHSTPQESDPFCHDSSSHSGGQCCFSLIENYPPKERRKLRKESEQGSSGTSSEGTCSPPRELDLQSHPCSSPRGEVTSNYTGAGSRMVSAAGIRKHSYVITKGSFSDEAEPYTYKHDQEVHNQERS